METIHAKMDGFSTAIKNQLSFNKMIETQLAQVAADMPPAMENIKAITTRGGKTTQDLPYPNHVNRKKASPVAEEPPREEEPEKFMTGRRLRMNFMILKYCHSLCGQRSQAQMSSSAALLR